MSRGFCPAVPVLTVISLLLAGPTGAPAEVVLVELGDAWRYSKGLQAPSDPPAAWREPDFDDSGWLEGPSGIGYGDGDDATVLDDMEGNYLSLFTRRAFEVPDPAAVRSLVFSADYDDGFIVYLNGVELVRRNMGSAGEDFAFDRPADVAHEAGTLELIDATAAVPLLRPGRNVLAIQVHSWALTSTDLTMRPRLLANSLVLVSPVGLACSPQDADGDGRVDRVALSWTNRAAYDAIRILRDGAALGAPLPGGASTAVDDTVQAAAYRYEVIATIGGEDCPPLSCSVTVCHRINLICTLSLQDGRTAALLTWDPQTDVDSIDIVREGTALETLGGGETEYVDPDVESLEPEDDTDFTIVLRRDAWTCSAACGPISLCPELTCRLVEVDGEPVVRLEWGNMVKLWESFTVLRDGVEIAS
ncbi:MAG: hypothetical protein HY721_23590, partial [Planctomycetes bacterium]|nr:hypothetical protein [Planctomycetota bacterium]